MKNTEYNEPRKTVGKQMAHLLMVLHDRSMKMFGLEAVQEITGLRPDLASSLIKKAVRRGLVSRIKRGLFVLVPEELGSTASMRGSPTWSVGTSQAERPIFYLTPLRWRFTEW